MPSPLVSVVTPVYNGARYLAECIESVRSQAYETWEYLIVNNCSTDATLAIATGYAARDRRIRVVSTRRLLDMYANHNLACRLISPRSQYCKVVPADDWITPDCLARLVRVGERQPRAGIIGSYQRRGEQVQWMGLPVTTEVIAGPEVCRRTLLGELNVFGSTTSCLYRASLVRARASFFPHGRPHADTSVCYRCLQDWDFGFVHAALSVEREHDARCTARSERLHMGTVAYLEGLLEYGPTYLTPPELERRTREVMAQYYRFLGGCLLKLREAEFWSFHRRRMQELGHPIQWRRVLAAALAEVREEMGRPRIGFAKLAAVVRQRCQMLGGRN